MDRHLPPHPSDRQFINHHAPPPSGFPPPFHMQPMQTAQPPTQIPFSDPFPPNRDPFLPASHGRRGSIGPSARGWPPAQGNGVAPSHNPPLPHPPPPPPQHMHGPGPMPAPYETSRRRSLGAAGSPQQYGRGPMEPHAAPPSFPTRHMPPPSPPQMHPTSSTPSMLGNAPRGPPTSSPFAGIRDLASFSSTHRPTGGMSISSILGGGDDARGPAESPHASAAAPRSMQPPSPGRARSSSMREGYNRGREHSPGRLAALGEQRPASAALGHDRFPPEARRDGMFRSPQPPPRESAHSFRAFRAPPSDHSPQLNGVIAPGRPSSQPVEPGPTRSLDDIMRRDDPSGGRLGVFRAFGDGPHKPRGETMPRHDAAPFQHNAAPTSQPVERHPYDSPASMNGSREQMPGRYQPGAFGTPMREDQAGLFRPAYQPHPQTVLEQAREPLEARSYQDMRRDMQRSSPPLSDKAPFDRYRNGSHERPLTFEEHQRMEVYNREQQQRKESDGSVHRAIRNFSPEMNRLGRNSPLPQAVQGAQPRHIRPGEDHPGIKSEFGRMFSGLGSGVGSATPTAGQSANGVTTPSRMSPTRQVESGDLVRTAVAEIDEGRGGAKVTRGARKNNRRQREERENTEAEVYDGRMTPSLSQRGSKRARTAHHHHHHAHHHHHYDQPDAQRSPFNIVRFPSNPLSHSALAANPAHHHHHHHTAHAHPGHHHHHPPRPVSAIRKPTLTINNKAIFESVAHKPRHHLGSTLYTASVSMPPSAAPSDPRSPYLTTASPIPKFEGKENCTFTVRVPRWYLTRSDPADSQPSRYETICKSRNVFGTEVYTDDSDVVAAAVHSGWLRGDFGEWNDDLANLCDNDESDHDGEANGKADGQAEPSTLSYTSKPRHPVLPPAGLDAHITLLILPPLEHYPSTLRHHMLSREWAGTRHDGMSFAIETIDFVEEGDGGRFWGRGAKGRKERMEVEEREKREAALVLAGLGLGLGSQGMGGGRIGVGVGA